MSSKIFFIFPLMFLSALGNVVSAQSTGDSLLNSLKIAKEDTNKARILATLSTYYLYSDPAKSLSYANECLTLATKIGYKNSIITAYESIAGHYYYAHNSKLAEEYSMKAIPFIQQTNNKAALCDLYNNLSRLATNDAYYSKAMDYSYKAMKIAEEMKDSSLMANVLSARGDIYMLVSDYSSAIKCLLQAVTLNEKKNYKVKIAHNYYCLAYIYRLENNNSDKALSYYEAALKLSKESNDRFQEVQSLEQLGEIYYEDKKEFDIALNYFRQSLNISQLIGSSPNIAACDENIALVFNEEGKTDSALLFSSKALLISEQINDKIRVGTCYSAIGMIYMNRKDYTKAISFLLKSLAIAKEVGQKNNETDAIYKLAKSYEAINDFKTSGTYWQQYAILNDSLLNEKTVRETSEMEARYSLAGKEKQIALLTTEKDYQKQKFTLLKEIFIGGLALVTLLFLFAYRNYRTRQLLKLQTLRNKIAIDLHDDIGSTLSSISIFSLMARQESKEVIPMLDQIGEYSRKMLESMADIVWTINPENDNFEKIILRMRSFAFELLGAKNIDFEFNTDESVSDLKLSMDVRKNLYLIFKEATNNMVKYAGANSALFSITGSKNNLTMLIRDNGKGFDLDNLTQGNGLKNMKNRALEIGARFLIESEPGKGTTIQLLIKTA